MLDAPSPSPGSVHEDPPFEDDVPVAPRRERRRRSAFRLTHRASLDGLRGLAVLAVVLFHTGHLTGGFLGVDLFFVLSGFLITSLLLQERQDNGEIAFKQFWLRRARRLLPAMFAVLAGVVVYAVVFADPTELGRIRSDSLATLTYIANWHGIAAGHGYWDQFGPPSPLQHTWSLAIEEQFYLVWPLLLGGVLWWRRGSRRAVLSVCIAFALAGAVWMAIQFQPDATDRAYLGTDTRIPALLIGAALAAWLQWKGPVATSIGRRRLEWVAYAGAAWLAVNYLFVSGQSPILYFGGIFLCGLAVAAILAAAVHPEPGPVSRVLSVAPLGWLGLISYGLYLWHWPIIVVLTEDRTGLDGWSLTFVQIGVSLAVAVVSYYVIEMPIRRQGLAAWKHPALMPIVAVAIVLALIVVTRNAVDAPTNDPSAHLTALQQQTDAPMGVLHPEIRADKSRLVPRPDTRYGRLLVVGDSVGYSLGTPLEGNPDGWKLQTANRATPACTLDRDSGRTLSESGAPRQEAPVCKDWPTRWASDVATFQPDAVLMIFGGLNGEPRQIDGAFHGMCETFTKDWYRRELNDAMDILTAKGASVFVTPFAYSKTTQRPKATETADCLNPVIREAVAAHPFAHLIPLDTWVCQGPDQCKESVDGEKLRWDGLHYRDHAADVANAWIMAQVFSDPLHETGSTGPPTTAAGSTATTLAPLPPPVMATIAPGPSTTRPRAAGGAAKR